DGNTGSDDRWHQAVIEPRRRGLNPLQSPARDDFVPRDRHLGMSHEDVSVEQFGRNPLLPGIDELVVGRGGDKLLVVATFDRIAKNDPQRYTFVILAYSSLQLLPSGVSSLWMSYQLSWN